MAIELLDVKKNWKRIGAAPSGPFFRELRTKGELRFMDAYDGIQKEMVQGERAKGTSPFTGRTFNKRK